MLFLVGIQKYLLSLNYKQNSNQTWEQIQNSERFIRLCTCIVYKCTSSFQLQWWRCVRVHHEKRLRGQPTWPIAHHSQPRKPQTKTDQVSRVIQHNFQPTPSLPKSRQLVFERLKENSIAFPVGTSQWFIALLPGRVCRVGTPAMGGRTICCHERDFIDQLPRKDCGAAPSTPRVIFFDRKLYRTPLQFLFSSNSISSNGL